MSSQQETQEFRGEQCTLKWEKYESSVQSDTYNIEEASQLIGMPVHQKHYPIDRNSSFAFAVQIFSFQVTSNSPLKITIK